MKKKLHIRKKSKLNIYFILSDENLFHPYYFLGILHNISQKEYEIVGVTVIKEMYKKSFFNLLYQQYKLWRLLGFVSIAGMSITVSIFDKLHIKQYSSIRSIAQMYKIPFIEIDKVNDKNHLAQVRNLHPDIIISSCGQIFKSELLSIPTIACINRHTALLPKYGGVLPVFWAMYYGEKEFGVSIHYMTDKVDQGDIIAQVKIPLKKRNSLFKNYILGFKQSIPVTLEALSNLRKNKIAGFFYENPKAYFSFPDNITLSSFRKRFITFSLYDIYFHRRLMDTRIN